MSNKRTEYRWRMTMRINNAWFSIIVYTVLFDSELIIFDSNEIRADEWSYRELYWNTEIDIEAVRHNASIARHETS